MDILQQEDIVKGLPDAALQMELQMPSGRIPEFLVLSEVQRRADMRQRFAAQEPMPSSTVKQQVMAQGLASMAAPLPSVPAGPDSSLPSVPAGSAPEGPVGMGGLGMAAGGKTKTKSDFPDYSGDGEITKKDILIGRGVLPMQDGGPFSDRVIDATLGGVGTVADMVTPDNPFILYEILGGYLARKGIDIANATQAQIQQALSDYELEKFGNPRELTPDELMSRYETLERMGVDPRTGPRNRFDEAAAEVEAIRAGRPDLVEMSEFEKSLLTPGQRVGQELVEAGRGAERTVQEVVDPIVPYTEALAGEAKDFVGTVTPPAQTFIERYTPDFLSNVPQGLRDAQRGIVGPSTATPSLGDAFAAQVDRFQSEVVPTFQERVAGADDLLTDFGEYLSDSYLGTKAKRLVEPFLLSEEELGQTMFQNMFPEASEAVKTDNKRAANQVTTTESTGTELADGSGTDGSDREITDNFLTTTLLGGDQGNPIMDQAYSAIEELKTSQGDVQTNLQDLITQTQQDAKNRALYAGVMGLAQGIAAGDMAKGLERASDQAGRIMAASETAVAPLRAAQAVAPTENLKAQIDAITDLARADATYQSVAAQFRREEGLDRRSQAQLMSAATRMVDTVFEDGVFTDFKTVEEAAAARAAAAKQIYDELSLMYGDSMIPSSAGSTFTRTPDGNLRYVVQ